eukprot:691782-Prorocentrum_minimum.AAC.1
MAAIAGDTVAIKTLVACGADPNYENSRSYTALAWAAEMGKLESIKALVECGASVDHESKLHLTPLMHAAALGKTESIAALVNDKQRVSQAERIGRAYRRALAVFRLFEPQRKRFRALEAPKSSPRPKNPTQNCGAILNTLLGTRSPEIEP